jgi:hypothetical protein
MGWLFLTQHPLGRLRRRPQRVSLAAAFFGASPVVASALDLRSGATPAEIYHTTKGEKPLARSVRFLNDPTETISVMLLNDLTGADTGTLCLPISWKTFLPSA